MSTADRSAPAPTISKVAVVVGIIAVASMLVPFVGPAMAPWFGLLAVVLGVLGVSRSRRSPGNGDRPAVVGIVLGVAALIVAAVTLLTGFALV